MHKRLFRAGVVALAVGLGGIAVWAWASEQKVPLEKVPGAVRATIQKHAEDAKVQEVEAVTKEGKTVYDVEIRKGGKTVEFSVSADGKYLGTEEEEDDEGDEAAPAKREAKLPGPVATTFKKAFPKAKITKVDVDQENGATVYDIEFKDAPAAVQAAVKKLVGKGKIVEFAREKDGNYELDYQAIVARSAVIAPNGRIRETEEAIEASALPKVVAAAVKKLYPGGKIERAETSTTDNGTVYELKVVVGKQRHSLTVSADGKVKEERK